jgi:hypothetical protein
MSSPGSRICMVPGSSPASATPLASAEPSPSRLSSGLEARDKAGEHGGGFLAHQFGVVVLVEFVEFDQRARKPRFAANLSGRSGRNR